MPAGRVRKCPLRQTTTEGEQEADGGGLDVSSDVVEDAEDDGEEKEGKGEEVSLAGDQIWLTVPRPCYQFLPVLSAPGTVSRPPAASIFGRDWHPKRPFREVTLPEEDMFVANIRAKTPNYDFVSASLCRTSQGYHANGSRHGHQAPIHRPHKSFLTHPAHAYSFSIVVHLAALFLYSAARCERLLQSSALQFPQSAIHDRAELAAAWQNHTKL